MLGARATDGPEEIELKKDQLRLEPCGCVTGLGVTADFASVALETDSAGASLMGAAWIVEALKPLVCACGYVCLEPDAMGTSNMS